MKELLLTLLHLAVTAAKFCGPGGVRAVIAENLLEFARFPVRRHAEWPGVTGRVTVVTTIGPPRFEPSHLSLALASRGAHGLKGGATRVRCGDAGGNE